ncbi:MAG TPA: response regulator transcription factor [Kiritimatiellia bacterium]|jgi:RNA polymerase sigma factor (sigma-70 family)|nr:response regulator transcription factor [Kiritimatiellia bacterium]HPW75006.1 response regulator transcription factor [Kiritimatiellia bacterium]HRU19761.1 response regulator transcription factor [Kiritimatiellia bacterium]
MKTNDPVSETASAAIRPTIFLVDDDPSVRKALPRLLQAAGYEVITFASAQEFLDRPRFDGDGCLVLDVRMTGMDGLALQEELAKDDSPLPIVFITGHGDVPMSVRAMKRGATDFLTKPIDQTDLLQAVQAAIQKNGVRRKQAEERQQACDCIATLTPRERDVMKLVVAGLLNKQIAQKLGICEATVKVHRRRVMKKMGVASVAGLVKICFLCDHAG